MASASPTRRVLSPLNVNSTLTRGTDSNSIAKTLGEKVSLPTSFAAGRTPIFRGPENAHTQDPTRAEKPQEMAKGVSLGTSQASATVQGKAAVGGEKRDLDDAEDGVEVLSAEPPRKRFKKADCGPEGLSLDGQTGVPEYGVQADVGNGEGESCGPDIGRPRADDGITSISSPPSSAPSPSTSALNEDSQQTVITEPDLAPQPLPASATDLSSKEGLAQRAQALKLRLRLASYKVHTNQINIPLGQLQIRTTSASSKLKRTPLPLIPSSPPARKEVDRVEFATPILPRQRQGLLHPPNLSATREEELTSSVVKGRAADGLLSLMRQV